MTTKKPAKNKRKSKKAAPRPEEVIYMQTPQKIYFRPNKSMSLSKHKMAGQRLTEIHDAFPSGSEVRYRVEIIKCELDNWLMHECPRAEMPNVDHFYYQHLPMRSKGSLNEFWYRTFFRNICNVRSILKESYPDCESLRRVQSKLETILKILNRHHEKSKLTSDQPYQKSEFRQSFEKA